MKARPVSSLPGFAAIAMLAATLVGCPSDPYDPDTWIDKLDDPAEVEAAITQLSNLGDPKAIKPLGATWRKYNKASKVLRVIVDLASRKEGPPPDKKEGPFWDDAVPILIEAVEEYERGNTRSIEDAAFAAEALGRSGDQEAVPVLIRAANKKLKKLAPDQRLRIAAVKALGGFPKNPKAIETLIKVLNGSLEDQPINLNAAAAIALGETRSVEAIEPLLKALFEIPPIYPQARTALTRIGAPAVPVVLKVFKNEHEAVNALAKKQGFQTDCDKAQGPESNCKAPGNIEFKGAALLGDLRAKSAVPEIVKGLKREPEVSFFGPGGVPGPSSHNAMLDALRNIGATEASEAVYDYMKSSNTEPIIRPLAIDVYSMLSRDTKALSYLGELIVNDAEEEGVRRAAALAFARLVKSDKDLNLSVEIPKAARMGKSSEPPLQFMVRRYEKEAADKRKEADKAKKKEDKDDLEQQAKGFDVFVRLFREHLARAKTGAHCKDDPKCYAGMLSKKTSEIIKELKLESKGLSKAQMSNLRIAVLERSLLDLAKMGPKAETALDPVLAVAESSERIIRQGALLAMQAISKKPCQKCVDRLNEIILLQKDQSTLAALTHDTRVVRNYLERASK